MRYVIGGTLVFIGGLVVYGGLTGRLPAMLAAIVKPTDLEPAGPGGGAGGASIGHPLDNLKSGLKTDPSRTVVDSIPIVGTIYEWFR